MELSESKKTLITNWMIRELDDDYDSYDDCGEINTTLLAENCAQDLNLYEEDDETIPEEVFEIAFEVSEELGNSEEYDE